MGQRFQVYVNYGPNSDHLFAMHLQWCWGAYSAIRAHQLITYLEAARQNKYNPFGLGEEPFWSGPSIDGRREDLHILKALTEINTVSKSFVEGADLMQDENNSDKYYLKEGRIDTFPSTIQIDPSTYHNDDGMLIIQATGGYVKYALCEYAREIKPVSASKYVAGYPPMIDEWSERERTEVLKMLEELEEFELLTTEEIEQIFAKSYDKKLNIEDYQE